MDDFPKLWMSIRADLHRACTLLPGSSEDSGSFGSFHQYHEFVEQNELELACDALEESAKDRAVSSDFWLALRDAAQKMGLGKRGTIRKAGKGGALSEMAWFRQPSRTSKIPE